ncbi:MAG: pilus assembly PilX N-terminal domain-containing protein [Candidatus Paceibacterota bacterium]|jgi:Tfp pilus assembly protein PilX|nr:hypothetical protein [Candidatus Paceibacterota bacterium]
MFQYHVKKVKKKFSKPKTGGFFLLYAILFSTIMLIIGMAILDISLKQLQFSGIDRESMRAFYAADAAIECAIYGDMVNDVFSTSTPGILLCNGDTTSMAPGQPTNPPAFSFIFRMNQTSAKEKTCAKVTVTRTINPVDGSIATTTISALGYNTECPPGAATRFPVVERGLKLEY